MYSNRVKKYFYISIVLLLLIGGATFYYLSKDQAIVTSNYSKLVSDSEREAALPTPSPSSQVLGEATQVTEISYDKLYSLINGYRREHRLTALKAHRALEQSAASKLQDMRERKYWTHKDPQGRESWYLFEQVGYHYEKAGENLSFGYTTEWKVFDEWTKSPEHNAQLLTPEYEHMGLAIDCETYQRGSEKTCIVVLHFGKQLL